MKLLVGLGNPGASYADNRHNVGFMALDAIAEAHGFAPWRAKFNARVAEGRIGSERALLLKPDTYMNLSGDAVRAAAAFFKLALPDIIVFHDELDLAPGKLRVKAGGGSAGHNGLRSLDAHLGPGFVRVRIGIGHPGDKRLVTNHVLGDFAKADRDWLQPVLEGIAAGAPDLVRGDGAGFLNAVARRLPPPATPEPKPKPTSPEAPPEPKAEPEAPDTRSALQRLADRFR